jgi:hypothetical protein
MHEMLKIQYPQKCTGNCNRVSTIVRYRGGGRGREGEGGQTTSLGGRKKVGGTTFSRQKVGRLPLFSAGAFLGTFKSQKFSKINDIACSLPNSQIFIQIYHNTTLPYLPANSRKKK